MTKEEWLNTRGNMTNFEKQKKEDWTLKKQKKKEILNSARKYVFI